MLQYSEGEADISDDELQSLKVNWQVEYHWMLNSFRSCVNKGFQIVCMYLDFLQYLFSSPESSCVALQLHGSVGSGGISFREGQQCVGGARIGRG